jgi:hypothetical protein
MSVQLMQKLASSASILQGKDGYSNYKGERMNSADLCKKNGWTVGTVLQGDEGFGPSTIVITAIGETVLANGDSKLGRDWKRVSE